MRPSMSIWTPRAWPSCGRNSGVGKARADHQQRVAVHHQVPARLGAEQADRPGDERQVVRDRGLAEQRLGDAGAEDLGDLDDLVGRARARPRRPASRPARRRSAPRPRAEVVARRARCAAARSRCPEWIVPCARGGCSTASSSWTSSGTMMQVTVRSAMRDAQRAVDQVAHLLGRRCTCGRIRGPRP